MIPGAAFLGDRAGPVKSEQASRRASALGVALDAYKYLVRNFWPLSGLLLLPILAAGLVLYVTLSWYLSGLLLFLETPDPRIASLALGSLAAGLFLALFCYSMAVSSVCDLTIGKVPRRSWLHLKAERQTWRIYAAYLRLLLLMSAMFGVAFLLSAYVAPLLLIPHPISSWVLTLLSVTGLSWLFARVGFPIAPIVATSEGAILRKARLESARDLWPNCLLIMLLLLPGILVLTVGGYAFRMGGLRVGGTLLFSGSVRSMKEMLGGFVTVISLAMFVSIVLLTVGAIAAYQNNRLKGAWGKPKPGDFNSNWVGCPVQAEGPPK